MTTRGCTVTAYPDVLSRITITSWSALNGQQRALHAETIDTPS